MILIDLFCGLGGWSAGFLAEGWTCIGIDIERHQYGDQRYPGQLILQDALTIHGSQFRHADAIVASPPCQEYSYMAMPWKRAKQIRGALLEQCPFPDGYTGSRTVAELNRLFNACFRIQHEASEAAGRHIPMVVENVKGAQPWVGAAKAHFGSFYLWGDIGSVGGAIVQPGRVEFGNTLRTAKLSRKVPGFNFHQSKNTDGSWFAIGSPGQTVTGNNPVHEGIKAMSDNGKAYGGDFGWDGSPMRRGNSHSSARKAASAEIAKIPFALSRWVAATLAPI